MKPTHIQGVKTLIIGIWLGKWPTYLPYFLKSISRHPEINWLFISDQRDCPAAEENLQFKHLAKGKLFELISGKLGFPVHFSDPRKLCDFKPAYGILFSEYLAKYDYWGFCDFDLVIGDLGKFLKPLYASGTEVISLYESFVSGPLCLFKNSAKTHELFKIIPGYREILNDPEYLAMDENHNVRMAEIARYSNPKVRLKYLIHTLFNNYYPRLGIEEIKYRYQWFLKRKAVSFHPPYDMTDTIFLEESNGRLLTYFEDLLFSDRAYQRRGIKKWEITWEDGKLREAGRNREIPVFHFIELKKKLMETYSNLQPIKDRFSLNENGFN